MHQLPFVALAATNAAARAVPLIEPLGLHVSELRGDWERETRARWDAFRPSASLQTLRYDSSPPVLLNGTEAALANTIVQSGILSGEQDASNATAPARVRANPTTAAGADTAANATANATRQAGKAAPQLTKPVQANRSAAAKPPPAAHSSAPAPDGSALIEAIALFAAMGAADGVTAAGAREIGALMDGLTPEALGLPAPRWTLGADGHAHERSADAPLSVRVVHRTPAFEILLFEFAEGAAMPLHDHPGMHVFSKVLHGELAMRAYEWERPITQAELTGATTPRAARARADRRPRARPARPSRPPPSHALHRSAGLSYELTRLKGALPASEWPADAPHEGPLAPPRAARCAADTVLKPESPTVVLTPRRANIHTFTALRPSVVLDVLLPPYDDGTRRDCHYFELAPNATGEPRLRLRVAPPPDGFAVAWGAYDGPTVHGIPPMRRDTSLHEISADEGDEARH
jgi:hypothetical protein